MSVVMVDGFDLYNGVGANTGLAAKWTAGSSLGAMAAGRFGGQAWQLVSANGRGGSRTLPGSYASFSHGFACQMTALPSASDGRSHVYYQNGVNYGLAFRITDGGIIEARLHTAVATQTLLADSGSQVIFVNTWHYIEVEAVIDGSSGSINIYVDGVQVVTFSGDTLNGANTTVDTLRYFANTGSVTTLGTMLVDDLYFTDAAAVLGPRRVETLYPGSDVAQGFGRSTGSTNYTLVDEAQANGDTDYVQGSSVSDTDTYGFGNLSTTPVSIDAVQLSAFAMRTDAASREIALQAISGATTSDGANFALAGSYGKHERLMLTDPDTGSAWAASAVNALEAGPKVTV